MVGFTREVALVLDGSVVLPDGRAQLHSEPDPLREIHRTDVPDHSYKHKILLHTQNTPTSTVQCAGSLQAQYNVPDHSYKHSAMHRITPTNTVQCTGSLLQAQYNVLDHSKHSTMYQITPTNTVQCTRSLLQTQYNVPDHSYKHSAMHRITPTNTVQSIPSTVLTHLVVAEDAHADAQFVLGVLGRDDGSDAGPSVLGGARSTATLRAESNNCQISHRSSFCCFLLGGRLKIRQVDLSY